MNNRISLKHLTAHILVQTMIFFVMLTSVSAAQLEEPFAAPADAPSGVGIPKGTAASAIGATLTPIGAPAINSGIFSANKPSEIQAPDASPLSPLSTKLLSNKAGTPKNKPTLQEPVTDKSTLDPSVIEAAMMASGKDAEKTLPQKFQYGKLLQFGYSFFRAEVDPFAAMNDIPVGPDYLLGTGDRINLTVWGSIDGSYQLEVNRNGELVIPKVGPIKVAGVSFGQLPQLLTGQLSRIFRNYQLSVTMGKLRMIKVYVVGDVNSPGDYNISSMSTLLNALSAAGGPTRNGTLRSIAIKRDGKLVDTVDLYEFFLKGDKSRDIRLQPGDTVFVPTIGPVAGITGNVRRPAIFELKNEKTLKDLLALADGIVPTGYLQRLQISRVDAYEKKSVTDVNLDPKTAGKDLDTLATAIPIKDMDLVKIFPIDSTVRGYARLSGYVLRPGDYAVKPGMTLRDLLPPDNLLPEYHQSVGSLIRLVPPDLHPEVTMIHPANAAAGKPGFNLDVQEFDTIRIYSRWEMEEMPRVRINGDVQKPGEYRLLEGMTVRDLLYTAGNVKMTAFLKNAEIARMRRTGDNVTMTTMVIDLGRALDKDPKHNLLLEPFDELSVRRIPSWAEETERYVTISGEILFPGTYPIIKGEHLSDILRRAGGFTDRSYLRGAKLTRRSVRELQQKRMDEVLVRAERDITQKQATVAAAATSKEELDGTKAALDALQKNTERLKIAKAEGRVVIHLNQGQELKDSEYDLLMEGGDTFDVPSRPSVVNILGTVYNPSSFVYLPNRSLSSYLDLSGGTTIEAETSDMYVIRADGSVFSRQQTFFGGFLSSQLEPGDTLVVPQKLEKTAWMREIKDWTQILANLAITAGTVMLGLR